VAWIESHQELLEHPKTKKLIRMLGISEVEAIGHLHCLWWWAMDYAQDGDLSCYDVADIADAAHWKSDPQQFVDVLCNCGPGGKPGFIERTDDWTLAIHDWHKYGGKLLRRRQADAERKKESERIPKDIQRNSEGTPKESARREEDPREDQNTKDLKDPPSPPAPSPLFEQAWLLYPVKKEKQKALELWRKEKLDRLFDVIRNAIDRQNATKKANDAAGTFYPEFPYFHRWLKNRRWEDEDAAPSVANRPFGKSSRLNDSEMQARIAAKEEKYKDVYLS
jgi:hypothetical protein